ncbi:DUF2637 domain-containing protein [Streptomyces sp. NPDC004838]
MKRLDSLTGLAAGAAVVTIALTGAAFWLSYEHLHDVAAANGLTGARAWAWPGTVDLFIIAGELLILRAALRRRVDWFAYLLAGVGSLGSIALNVAGVGTGAELMEYIVAAVPPSAALIAFAALMRQVHEHLVPDAEDTPALVIEVEVDRPEVPTVTPTGVTAVEKPAARPELPAPVAEPLVICGDRQVWHPVLPSRGEDDEVTGETTGRLPTKAAANVIHAAWVTGTSVPETARLATRSTSYVKKVFARLDEQLAAGPRNTKRPEASA